MAENKESDFTFKMMLLGESEIGKTCFIQRYITDKFANNYISTIGIDFQTKFIQLNGKSIKLLIWDTAGQENYKCITKSYFKTSHGFVLAYDTTRKASFECVNEWLHQIRENGSKNIRIVLIGTKCDLEDEREISAEEGEKLAKENGIKFFETSSKEEINVKETFMHLAGEIFTSIEKGEISERMTITIGRNTKKPEGDSSTEQAKKCC